MTMPFRRLELLKRGMEAMRPTLGVRQMMEFNRSSEN
jgi:hypothetical protein